MNHSFDRSGPCLDVPELARASRESIARRSPRGALLPLAAALLVASCASTKSDAGYSSPEAAVEALVSALRPYDPERVREVLGLEGDELLSSGDEVADRADREDFLEAYDDRHALLASGDQAILIVGGNEWPLPIPLVRTGDTWRFDLEEAREEILARRIGENELSTIQVCRAIVDAQYEYRERDPMGRGAGEFATRVLSSDGQRDGLYWPTGEGEPASPLGPLVAEAAKDGYTGSKSGERSPYHGYYYRLLTAQGPAAPGGALSYLSDGRLTGGFAVLAEPATYGNSGVMSFLVGPTGVVYERDLGPKTSEVAGTLVEFNPDAGWKVVAD